MNAKALNKTSCFIISINDFICKGHIYLISHKLDAISCFEIYSNKVNLVKVLKCSALIVGMSIYLIRSRKCVTKGTSIDNWLCLAPFNKCGRRKKYNVDCLMVRRFSPSYFGAMGCYWAHILNCLPFKSVNIAPCRFWTNNAPSLEHLRPWDLVVCVHFTFLSHIKLGLSDKKVYFCVTLKIQNDMFLRKKQRWYSYLARVTRCRVLRTRVHMHKRDIAKHEILWNFGEWPYFWRNGSSKKRECFIVKWYLCIRWLNFKNLDEANIVVSFANFMEL